MRISDVIQNKVCVIVVDEAHCVIDWGDDYRPMFKEIKRLRSVIPCAKILALSATLSTHGQLKNVTVVSSKTTKNNISLIMVPRPLLTTLVSTKDTFGYVFVPLLCEPKSKGQEFPLTLVYCSGNIDWVGYGFEIASKILDKDMFVGSQSPKNQWVAMYHSCIEKGDKVEQSSLFTPSKMVNVTYYIS